MRMRTSFGYGQLIFFKINFRPESTAWEKLVSQSMPLETSAWIIITAISMPLPRARPIWPKIKQVNFWFFKTRSYLKFLEEITLRAVGVSMGRQQLQFQTSQKK